MPEARAALKAALADEPKRSDLALALADACRAAGRFAEAERVLREFLSHTPAASVMRMLAAIMADQHRHEDAVALGREVFMLGHPDGDFVRQFCAWCAETGEYRAAIEHLTRYLRDRDEDAEAWLHLGDLWLAVQESEKAGRAWEHYRALCPEDPARTAVRLAAASGENLSPDYVRALFDGYAAEFDDNLRGKLRYQAPSLLRRAVERARPGMEPCDILDLGCGTGLAGREFASLARFMAGIDLSPRMLAHAEATGFYHQLIAGEVVAAIPEIRRAFDLALAADVLVYLGDLAPLFRAVYAALRPGGLFAATVERLESGEDFILQPQRRYAHGEAYLRRLAAENGFRICTFEPCVPRHEKGKPVDGFLFVLEKAD